MVALVGTIAQVRYDPKAGQYRGSNGKFVGRDRILSLVNAEVERTEARLAAHTRLLAADKITLGEWEKRFATTLKDSHIRMAVFASGGKENTTRRAYGATGYNLRQQYDRLDGFAHALKDGELTEKGAIARSRLYAKSIKETFYQVEKQVREDEGFTVAKRWLDSQAKHCASCLLYTTKGEWRRVGTVVPPGVACACRAACKCQIAYAKLRYLGDSRIVD